MRKLCLSRIRYKRVVPTMGLIETLLPRANSSFQHEFHRCNCVHVVRANGEMSYVPPSGRALYQPHVAPAARAEDAAGFYVCNRSVLFDVLAVDLNRALADKSAGLAVARGKT